MTPRLSVIAASIRRVISNAVSSLDPFWDKVVSLIHGDGAYDKDDPYWNNVSLLIHGNGVNESTVITDQKGKAITAYGNASISTANSRFNGSSIYLDGSGDYLNVSNFSELASYAGNVTIECWFKLNSSPTGTDWNNSYYLFGGGPNLSNAGLDFAIGNTAIWFSQSNYTTRTLSGNWTYDTNWHHVAVVRDGDVWTMYLDGASIASATSVTAFDSSIQSFAIGRAEQTGGESGGTYFHGYIAEYRITKGVARYTTTFNVPTKPFPNQLPQTYDPFAANTVLALHMDGANGSTAFYDQCGKTVTANGNVQISTAQSKFGASSAYFDGTGDYLTVASSSDFGFGTGDFTVEFYMNCSFGAVKVVIDARPRDTATPWNLGINAAGQARSYDGSSVRTGGQLTASSWNHVAWCRSNNVNTVYVNGVAGHTWSAIQDFQSARGLFIGGNVTSVNEMLTGYISDLRITKGVARYTATFTPPTKQFPDPINDAVGKKPIPYGNATLGSGGVFGNCMQFDGTGDYYVMPSHTDFNFGSQDFTIEFWFKSSQTTAYACMLNREWVGSPYSGGFTIFLNNGTSGPLSIWWADYSGGSVFLTSSSNTHRDNQWHHMAWVRNGSQHHMFLDGVIVASAVSTVAFVDVTKRVAIGTDLTYAGRDFNGYIDELRITKGQARYTTTFTPQDIPHPDSYIDVDPHLSNVVMHVPMMSPSDKYWDCTSLLIPGNGANASTSIFEARGKTVTAVGNAQVSTTQSKFGGSSIYFDGSGDYLSVPINIADFTFTGDFTIECWIYKIANSSPFHIFDTRSGGNYGDLVLAINGSSEVDFVCAGGSGVRFTGGSFPTNAWAHLAFVRTNGVMKAFINGVVVSGTVNYTGTMTPATSTAYIGGSKDLFYANGYLQDLRITKGVARYIVDFTPPLKALLAFEDKKGNQLAYVGDAKLSRSQKKFTQISGYFNGTSSHVKTVSNVAANIYGQDITVEGWIYLADVVGEKCICGYNNASASDFWDLRVSTASLKFRSRASGSDTSVSGGTLTASSWIYVAVVKSGTKVTLYVDGVSVATSTTLAIPNIASAQIGIGANLYGGSYWDYFNGYMQDLRITQAARYLSNFAPPTLPLPMQ